MALEQFLIVYSISISVLHIVPIIVMFLVLNVIRNNASSLMQIGELRSQLVELHRLTNSSKDQLVALTNKEAYARGREEQRVSTVEPQSE